MTEIDDSSDPEEPTFEPPKDSALPNWLRGLPERGRPFAALARLDRPIGIWLLFLPCLMGLFQMRVPTSIQWVDLWWVLLFGVGSVVMRGAGCTWNDISDKDLDAQVGRTAQRPIPSGQVSLREAYIFLGGQLLVGFFIWLCLPTDAKIIALFSIALVGAYPFMKRVTWWPQVWLGFTFNVGALIGAATAASVTGATVVLYLGLVSWTIAYDTIYALQDVEDDALAGIKSTARLFDEKVLTGIFVFQLAATALIAFGIVFAGAPRMGALTGLAFLGFSIWQLTQLSGQKQEKALPVFKSSLWAGLLVLGGIVLATLF